MNEREQDRADLAEARAAVQAAKASAAKANEVVASIRQSSGEIRSLVEANGYVSRFRQVLRGTN